jgi:Aromatic-ring-opening dioxygenase LigAB, LigA subunit
MSLYQLQKFLFDLNRDPAVQGEFRNEAAALLRRYDLTAEERDAIARGDIGLIYVLGANGQLLMHFAAFLGMAWPAYIQNMRDGIVKHGPVRAGIYAMTTTVDDKVAGV